MDPVKTISSEADPTAAMPTKNDIEVLAETSNVLHQPTSLRQPAQLP